MFKMAVVPCQNVDILPAMLQKEGFLTSTLFESFSVLVPRANEWLAANPWMEVVNCESVETKLEPNSTAVNNEKSNFIESSKYPTNYVRFLRIWVRPKQSGDPSGPACIGYVNVVPVFLSEGGIVSDPQFEGFAETIGKVNTMFKERPLPGKILNVETCDTKFSKWQGDVDPDVTYCLKSARARTMFLSVIRIFYRVGQPANEQIGYIDIIPSPTGTRRVGLMSTPVFGPYAAVVAKANEWLKSQPPLNIVNMQSVDFKYGYGGTINTQQTFLYESAKAGTSYVRILRLLYLTGGGKAPTQNLQPTYRTFEPYQISERTWTNTGGTFETFSQTMSRAQAWLHASGKIPLAVETVKQQISQYPTGFAFCIRFYFDGPYNEPDPSSLPPPPPVVYTQQQPSICQIL